MKGEDSKESPLKNPEGLKVDDAVVDRCCQNLQERKKLGLIRYGKHLCLSTLDGRSPIQEAREEAEDLVVYLTWEEAQREKVLAYLDTLYCDVQELLDDVVKRHPDADNGNFTCPFMKKLWLDLEQGKEIREGILQKKRDEE